MTTVDSMTLSRADRIANLLAIVLPFLGALLAVVLLWNRAVDAIDLALLAGMYVVTGFGITVGYHRLFTHRSFATTPRIQRALAIAGSMALEGPLDQWVADHRKHHAHTDVEGDPHSPHLGDGAGVRGLWHAHVGWIFRAEDRADVARHAPDITEDPLLAAVSRRFLLYATISLLLPAALGFALHGFTLAGFLTGLLWGGLVRIFFLHHVTWSINSVCHFTGRRRFAVDDHSTNVFWLALPSLGESWHHNHHAFPRSAAHGLRRAELDPSAALIGLLRRLGLAWNVVEISPERQREREASPGAAPLPARGLQGTASGTGGVGAGRPPVPRRLGKADR
jgi:stearoyl-CoA desaturase (delta-9 desaturase)